MQHQNVWDPIKVMCKEKSMVLNAYSRKDDGLKSAS